MPVYTVEGPDGRRYKIEGPENATAAQLAAVIQGGGAPRNLDAIENELRTSLDRGERDRAEALQAELYAHPDFAAQRQQQLQSVNAQLGPQQVGTGEGAARLGLQGLTFGLADELGAAGAAGYESLVNGRDFSTEYGILHDKLTDERQRFSTENPKTAIAAELGGGVLTGGAGLAKGVAKMGGKSLLSKGATAAGVGATEGAIYGGAQGSGLEDRAQGALEGGITGAVLAPVAGAAASLGGRVLSPVAEWTTDKLLVGPNRAARRFLADDLATEGFDSRALESARRKLGPDAILADASTAARDSLEGVLSMTDNPAARNSAEQLFKTRNKGQQPRLFDDLQAELNVPADASLPGVLKALKEQRGTVADELYGAAKAKPLQATEKLQSILKADAVKKAAKDAEATLSNKRIGGDEISHIDYLDAIKQNLDDQIGAAVRQGEKGKVRDLVRLKKELVAEVDAQVPEYKAARDAYAGDSRLLDASEYGRKILREDYDVLDDVLQGMSDSEKQMFRLGAQRAIREKLMQAPDTHNATRRISSQLLRERMRRAFPDDKAFNRFIKQVEIEDDIFRTTAVLGNSKTAMRQDIQKRLKGEDIAGVEGGAFGMLAAWARKVAGAGLNPEAREELANLAMTRLGDVDLTGIQKSKQWVKLPQQARDWMKQVANQQGSLAEVSAIQSPIGVVGQQDGVLTMEAQ